MPTLSILYPFKFLVPPDSACDDVCVLLQSKVRSTLRQCVRDWAAEVCSSHISFRPIPSSLWCVPFVFDLFVQGAEERAQCYGLILKELAERFPQKENR